MPQQAPAPAIILVEPQLGENIGMVARAMANFGLTELRLVNPRDGWPNDKARAAASRADHVIDGAVLFPTLTEAIAGGQTKYLALEYKERNVTIPAPGVALVTGRAWVKVVGAAGEQQFDLSFLAAYREEQGKWRFLAWQSCRLPPATPAQPAK